MPRTIVIGYGNIDRADDGAAFHIINLLRQALGKESLADEVTGLEELGSDLDSLFIPQLTPELMDLLLDYERIIFVDAYTGPGEEAIHCARIIPECTSSQLFSHHLTPGAFLAFLQTLYNHTPESFLVSIRAEKFDFSPLLSPRTKASLKPACELILRLLEGGHGTDEVHLGSGGEVSPCWK